MVPSTSPPPSTDNFHISCFILSDCIICISSFGALTVVWHKHLAGNMKKCRSWKILLMSISHSILNSTVLWISLMFQLNWINKKLKNGNYWMEFLPWKVEWCNLNFIVNSNYPEFWLHNEPTGSLPQYPFLDGTWLKQYLKILLELYQNPLGVLEAGAGYLWLARGRGGITNGLLINCGSW